MALRKMRRMTVGNNNVIVRTDHLTLLGILKKPLEKIDTFRLMKFAEKLQDYSFVMEYVEGTKNHVADAFSTNPVRKQDESEPIIDNRLIVSLISEFKGKEMCSMDDLKERAKSDPDYNEIKRAIVEGIKAKHLPPNHPGRMYKSD